MSTERPVLVIGIQGLLVGLDVRTGAVVWEDGLKGGGYGEVAIAANASHVVASAHAGKLFCFSYPDGRPLWTADTAMSGRASIVIEGGLIFVAKSGHVDCYTFDGTRMWSQPLKGKGHGAIAMGFPGNIVQADDVGQK